MNIHIVCSCPSFHPPHLSPPSCGASSGDVTLTPISLVKANAGSPFPLFLPPWETVRGGGGAEVVLVAGGVVLKE